MEIAFQNRSEWRGRGRPPREPSPRVVELLRRTAATNSMATVTLDLATFAADLKELKADLRAASRLLGGAVHYQAVANTVNFFWEP
jgi:hypothetical protein